VSNVLSVVHSDWCGFIIFSILNFKASIWFLNVTEVFILVSEDLPPAWVSAPDLHIVRSSRWSNVPRLIV
jgi:hypothetical protein